MVVDVPKGTSDGSPGVQDVFDDGRCECDTEITNEEKEKGAQVMRCKARGCEIGCITQLRYLLRLTPQHFHRLRPPIHNPNFPAMWSYHSLAVPLPLITSHSMSRGVATARSSPTTKYCTPRAPVVLVIDIVRRHRVGGHRIR